MPDREWLDAAAYLEHLEEAQLAGVSREAQREYERQLSSKEME